MTRPPTVPKGLQPKGRKLWRDITSNYQLRIDELRLLEDACREADLIDRLETELIDAPLTVTGSMGQPVASPLVQEVRQHRGVLSRLFASLKLPDAEGQSQETPRATSAREAAMTRWGQRGA